MQDKCKKKKLMVDKRGTRMMAIQLEDLLGRKTYHKAHVQMKDELTLSCQFDHMLTSNLQHHKGKKESELNLSLHIKSSINKILFYED